MIQLKVNGVARTYDGDHDMPLLWRLRDVLGLTETKFECGASLGGACTVHQNGDAMRACVTPVSAADGTEIRIIEDLSSAGLRAVQKAWMANTMPFRLLQRCRSRVHEGGAGFPS